MALAADNFFKRALRYHVLPLVPFNEILVALSHYEFNLVYREQLRLCSAVEKFKYFPLHELHG